MHRIIPTMKSTLLGVAATAIFMATTHGQAIVGPPIEANHFIETPKGWVHPKTSWGEPDIQATLNMMQAAGVPLERCANSTRFGGPPCDMTKRWWTEEEYTQRLTAAGVQLTEPLPYKRFMSLVLGAKLVVTDSGGIQEETTYLGIACLTLRDNTERPITITEGTNRLVTLATLADAVDDAMGQSFQPRRPEFWDGHTAARCVADLRARSR